MRKAAAAAPRSSAPPSIGGVLRSPGEPLPGPMRERAERRFGHDFSGVRVHADAAAGRSTAAVGAEAWTVGEHIAFAPGRYRPGTPAGDRLLAHELTHVLQQGSGRDEAGDLRSAFALEREAERNETALASGHAQAPRPGAAVAGPQYQLGTIAGVARAAAAGGLIGAADWAVANLRDNPVVQEGGALLARVRAHPEPFAVPRSVALALEAGYRDLRSLAPSWLPLPELSFAPPVQAVAGVDDAIILAALMLAVVATLIVMAAILIIALLHDLLVLIRRALDRPAPSPRPGPQPLVGPQPQPAPPPAPQTAPETAPRSRPGPETGPRPRPPLPPLDIEEDQPRRCRSMATAQRGNNDCHNAFATLISGSSREWGVATPEGLYADFDALGRDNVLYEIKTGYTFLLNTSPSTYALRDRTIGNFVDQSQNQIRVATRCGYRLVWVFNNPRVAEFVDGFIQPPVTAQPFDCDIDA